MNFFQAIILGLVQALTEYLPVSSSAHIRIIGDLMLGADPGAAFTAIIQIGTELAVILYFRRDIARILSHWFGSLFGKDGKDLRSRLGAHDEDTRMGWYIIVGTMPIVIAGLVFKHAIETNLRNLWITVTVLVVFGVLLWIFDQRSPQRKTIGQMTMRDAIVFGIGQMLALIPGVSRSGGTITFGRAMGYTREAAVRVSFLMAIPAVLGAGLLETVSAVKDINACTANPDPASEACVGMGMFPGWGPTIAATVVSFVVGYIIVIAFLKFVSVFSYRAFAIYRILLAVTVTILLIVHVLQPYESTASAAVANLVSLTPLAALL